MTDTRNQPTHEKVLNELAKAVDISQEKLEEARQHYHSLGNWLERPESMVASYNPDIGPQGSFLLGTANKPIGDSEKYDVDLVCRLDATKGDFTQRSLKDLVGLEVKAYAKAHSMKRQPEDKRRCWTLNYEKSTKFHMDVLPCIRDAEHYQNSLTQRGFVELAKDASKTGDALAITDKTDQNYENYCDDWPSSNPFGYAAWFKTRMAIRMHIRKTEIAAQMGVLAKAEDIPDHKVKTTLQKTIQLLKRHRDNMFSGDPDAKPISIIITTLAAHSYGNEGSLVEALSIILRNMDSDKFIEDRDGEKWIANPVNPAENFADKWAEDPTLQTNFYKWLDQARRDFGAYLNASPADELPAQLTERLGQSTANKVIKNLIASAAASTAAPIAAKVKQAVATVHGRGTGTAPYCPVRKNVC